MYYTSQGIQQPLEKCVPVSQSTTGNLPAPQTITENILNAIYPSSELLTQNLGDLNSSPNITNTLGQFPEQTIHNLQQSTPVDDFADIDSSKMRDFLHVPSDLLSYSNI